MARLLARGHRRSCPAFELALFAFLLAVRWPEVTVSGAPYMVLVTGAAKCFTVDAPRQTALEVRYHAPDLRLEDDPDELKTAQKMKGTNILVYQDGAALGIRSAMLGLVHPGGGGGGGAGGEPRGTGRIRHQLEAREGIVDFQTHPREAAPVEVCVQSYWASPDAPVRISIDVRRKSESAGRAGGPGGGGVEDAKKLSLLSSILSADLTRSEQRTKELGDNADVARDDEKIFHAQSVKLNRAVKYWPMFRMTVLVVGGYSQVTHVLRFMRSRHIF